MGGFYLSRDDALAECAAVRRGTRDPRATQRRFHNRRGQPERVLVRKGFVGGRGIVCEFFSCHVILPMEIPNGNVGGGTMAISFAHQEFPQG